MEVTEEPESVIIQADEVDEPPPPSEAYSTSKKHIVPDADTPEPSVDIVDQEDENAEAANDRSAFQTFLATGVVVPKTNRRPFLKRDTSNPGHLSERERLVMSAASFRNNTEEYFRNLRNDREVEGEQQGHMQEDSEPDTTQDSLSLGQLKELLRELPNADPRPYAFEYADASSFEEELEEMFDYSTQERMSLINAQTTFMRRWDEFRTCQAEPLAEDTAQTGWQADKDETKISFLHLLKTDMLGSDAAVRLSALDCTLYLALGCWLETAVVTPSKDESKNPHAQAKDQVAAIEANVNLIAEAVGIDVIFDVFRQTYSDEEEDFSATEAAEFSQELRQRLLERWTSLILLYLFVDLGGREAQGDSGTSLRNAVITLQPDLLQTLTQLLVKSRFDEGEDVTFSRLLLLFWKTILLFFGGTAEINSIKEVFSNQRDQALDHTGPTITASPLDYHMFRQEIISKYPAFDPPPPLFPFEPENNSILPLLQEHSTRSNSLAASGDAGPANIQVVGTSIMQQPIHIATPAPSPPPSPAGPGGKGIKKQNYQTNQMFPFMYPPLDHTSNDLGGKGSTEIQDLFAGRKWEGRDIPASILEAADLFSRRMRATRAMKQLWAERVRFLKFERGYNPNDNVRKNGNDLEEAGDEEEDEDLALLSEDLRARLLAVDTFYEASVQQLQSVVLVLLRVLLMTVTTLIAQPNAFRSQNHAGGHHDDAENGSRDHQTNGSSDEGEDPALADLAALREQEIMGKAVSGTLLLLLKWFKLSHILKFEYFSQLLLDSNYIQFILKLFTHQELERAVRYKRERQDLNFFALSREFARRHSSPSSDTPAKEEPVEDNTPAPVEEGADSESDDAAPPPIRMNRPLNPPPTTALPNPPLTYNRPRSDSTSPPEVRTSSLQPPGGPIIPEVDELGYPVSQLPQTPITNYSWRTFFTSINHLRILQKLVKAKPHRQLLMVQSKYSLTLKKHLKVPQHDVRLYTLKIIKGQVPYCHRKWRAGNMRTITAIYLHVKPGLRDEWLSGLDVEQEVGEALPQEQALRALTFWWHLRMYPDEFGAPNSGDSEDHLSDVASNPELLEALADMSEHDPRSADLVDPAALRRSYFHSEGPEVPSLLNIDIDGMPHPIIPLAEQNHQQPSPADLSNTTNNNSREPLISSPAVSPGTTSPAHPSPSPIPRDLQSFLDIPSPLRSAGAAQSSSRRSSTATSASSSTRRRSSAQAPTGDEDDFFLRELEKMDLGSAFAGVGAEAPPTMAQQASTAAAPASREQARYTNAAVVTAMDRGAAAAAMAGFYGDGRDEVDVETMLDHLDLLDDGEEDAGGPALEGTVDEDGNVVISRVQPDVRSDF